MWAFISPLHDPLLMSVWILFGASKRFLWLAALWETVWICWVDGFPHFVYHTVLFVLLLIYSAIPWLFELNTYSHLLAFYSH